jgi:predicted aspartyl protease
MKQLLLSLAAMALAMPAAAQQGAPTGSLIERNSGAPGTPETLGYAPDAWERMTVAVNIGGRGPYRFIVDTGAERTVISSELAAALNLHSTGDVTVVSVSTISRVPSVNIPELGVGRRTLLDIQAPSLSEHNIGAQGMLGVDSLASQRVTFDFRRRELSLSSSHIDDDRFARGEIVVRGRTRLGRLLFTNAFLDGQRITVIIDTGSQVTVGNAALRGRLERARRLGEVRVLSLTGVTGDIVTADYTRARRLQVGGIHIDDLPIAFSEVRLFSLLGLENRPAILLGMDALRLFDRVSIDFANRRVRLAPPVGQLNPPTRTAGLGPLRAR